jgi:hypothetical protein
VAFTRFNFLARRAFFHAMHLDLHAIRESVNELERLGYATVDCRDAGLTESESLDQVRHVVHQWKTPFRAPYSGGSSFLQLILLRHALQRTLEMARENAAGAIEPEPAPEPVFAEASAVAVEAPKAAEPVVMRAEEPVAAMPVTPQGPEITAVPVVEAKAPAPAEVAASSPPPEPDPSDVISRPAQNAAASAEPSAQEQAQAEEESYLVRCVNDIAEQLTAVPAKNAPAVSAIVLGGCKLLIATWEAQAFGQADTIAQALQRTVAARTILHVCMERHKKNEPTDLAAAMDIARGQAEEIKAHVEAAKEAKNIDAAVNLAATSKRLSTLVAEGEKLVAV